MDLRCAMVTQAQASRLAAWRRWRASIRTGHSTWRASREEFSTSESLSSAANELNLVPLHAPFFSYFSRHRGRTHGQPRGASFSARLHSCGRRHATPAKDAAPPTIVPAKLFAVPAGLEVTVWATTPLLHNPTNIDIDKDGRVWVAEGVNYRSKANRQPEGDKIVVLEDTTGAGHADKSTVFVQDPDLIAPLGVAVIEDKVIVSQPPNMLVFTDKKGDHKFDSSVDTREVLLTGFNGRNHDHSLHSLTAGPDGLWYFNQGNTGAQFTDKSGKTFRIGSPYSHGKDTAQVVDSPAIAGQKSDDGHVWVGGFTARMNPDGSNVEIIGFNYRNSYEQTINSFGDIYQSDNDDPPACRDAAALYGNAGFASADGKRAWGADRRPGQDVPTAEWRQEDPGTMPAGDVYGGGSPTGVAFTKTARSARNGAACCSLAKRGATLSSAITRSPMARVGSSSASISSPRTRRRNSPARISSAARTA